MTRKQFLILKKAGLVNGTYEQYNAKEDQIVVEREFTTLVTSDEKQGELLTLVLTGKNGGTTITGTLFPKDGTDVPIPYDPSTGDETPSTDSLDVEVEPTIDGDVEFPTVQPVQYTAKKTGDVLQAEEWNNLVNDVVQNANAINAISSNISFTTISINNMFLCEEPTMTTSEKEELIADTDKVRFNRQDYQSIFAYDHQYTLSQVLTSLYGDPEDTDFVGILDLQPGDSLIFAATFDDEGQSQDVSDYTFYKITRQNTTTGITTNNTNEATTIEDIITLVNYMKNNNQGPWSE